MRTLKMTIHCILYTVGPSTNNTITNNNNNNNNVNNNVDNGSKYYGLYNIIIML